MPRPLFLLCLLSLLALPSSAQQRPSPAAARWWSLTSALANDGMEGRDTGSPAYQRAADYVANEFKRAGLKPAGDAGTYFQRVRMHQVSLLENASSVRIAGEGGQTTSLAFPTQVTTVPAMDVTLDAPSVFLGYGVPASPADLAGKVVVFFNSTPAGLNGADRDAFVSKRSAMLSASGAVAVFSIDNPGAIEPFHWPAAYARSVTLGDAPPQPPITMPFVRVDSAAAAALVPAAPSFADLLARAVKGEELPVLAGPNIHLELRTEAREIASPNVLAVLPGSDPALASEYVALSAHLDGYGFGTPVQGDRLYNGALDDAAYVATLIELAQTVAKAPAGARPKRSLLFCIFTGEEKGLLGSAYFTHHLTVPREKIVADLNLDQLRPIFPLKILTMEGLEDSTLGTTVRTLAASSGIEIRPDLEPERSLFRRADNYNFVRIGVPIASFIFGYDRGSAEERTYRDWYARRYHKPQDDLSTPIDWAAAVKFNDFYRMLALTVANASERPQWTAASPYSPAAAAAPGAHPQ